MELKELYDKSVELLNKELEIFKDYYGEDRVDLIIPNIKVFESNYNNSIVFPDNYTIEEILFNINSENNPYILVYFPEVTITNEYKESHNIKDLYVKINLLYNGSFKGNTFYMLRTTYTYSEYIKRYIHSHAKKLFKVNSFSECCLGTGPLSNTINSLNKLNYNLDLCKLFCYELDKYTKVESIKGIPYIKLQSLSTAYSNNRCTLSSFFSFKLKDEEFKFFVDFIMEILHKKIIKFTYIQNKILIADYDVNFILTISNAYIEYCKHHSEFNSNNMNDSIMSQYVIKDNWLYTINDERVIIPRNKEEVLTFKGEIKYLNLIKDTAFNWYYLIKPTFLYYYTTKILKLINIYFQLQHDYTKNDIIS